MSSGPKEPRRPKHALPSATVADKYAEACSCKLAGLRITLDAILIRNVELPLAIHTAIDQKLAVSRTS